MKRTTMLMVAAILVASLISFGCSKSSEMAPGSLGDFGDIGSPPWQTGTDLTEEVEITPSTVDKVEIVLLGGEVIAADASRPFPRAIKAVRVTFSGEVDESTAEGAFSLLRDGAQVVGTFDWPDGRTIEFKPEKKSAYKAENVVALNGDEIAKYRTMALNDVNGDGYADIIIGGSEQTIPLKVRTTYLFWGGESLSDMSVDMAQVKIEGEDINGEDRFGNAPAIVGDLNADGYADAAIGAPLLDIGSNSDAGAVYIFFGGESLDGQTLLAANAPTIIRSNHASFKIGDAISAADDVNGDGYDDLLLSAVPAAGGLGEVYLFSGKELVPSDPSVPKVMDQTMANVTIVGEPGAYEFGKSISAGDIDGDGLSDIIVGSPIVEINGVTRGRAYVFLGSEGMQVQFPKIQLNYDPSFPIAVNKADAKIDGPVNPSTSPWFGHAVASAGDTDGDGRDDVLVGAPREEVGGNDQAGAVYLFLSGDLMSQVPPVATANERVIYGDLQKSTIGWSVASAGRFNDDAFSDFVVGGPLRDSYHGRAARLLGKTHVVEFQNGQQQPMKFGNAVAVLGDINGDGYSDIMVGAPQLPSQFNGEVSVYLGNPSGLFSMTNLGNFSIVGDHGNQQIGRTMGGQLSH